VSLDDPHDRVRRVGGGHLQVVGLALHPLTRSRVRGGEVRADGHGEHVESALRVVRVREHWRRYQEAARVPPGRTKVDAIAVDRDVRVVRRLCVAERLCALHGAELH
jgi:hypothetical protein